MMAQKFGAKHVVNLNEIKVWIILIVFWLTITYYLFVSINDEM